MLAGLLDCWHGHSSVGMVVIGFLLPTGLCLISVSTVVHEKILFLDVDMVVHAFKKTDLKSQKKSLHVGIVVHVF